VLAPYSTPRCDHKYPDIGSKRLFIGGVCFLVGALLLLPERTEANSD
jgi:hypothetical protein